MWKYIFNILLVSYALLGFSQQQGGPPQGEGQGNGQENAAQGTTIKEELALKEKPDWSPIELKIGINATRWGRAIFNPDFSSMEVQGGLTMHRAIAILEIGGESIRRGESFSYTNEGWFFRLGGNWNFIKDKSGNELSLGLRYARSSFEDELFFTDDFGFGEENFRYANESLNARWVEVILSIRGKIISNLYTGFTLRWQTVRKVKGEATLATFDIPGFGNTKRQNSTAFDYYFTWRIPFKKAEEAPSH